MLHNIDGAEIPTALLHSHLPKNEDFGFYTTMNSSRHLIRRGQHVAKRFSQTATTQGVVRKNVIRTFSAEAAAVSTAESMVKDAIKKMMEERVHISDDTIVVEVIQNDELENRFRSFRVSKIDAARDTKISVRIVRKPYGQFLWLSAIRIIIILHRLSHFSHHACVFSLLFTPTEYI